MAKLLIQQNATSQLATVFIQNNSVTTGAGLTGLAFGTSGLTAYYFREGDASSTAITLATMTLGTWATGGFIVADGTNMPGTYQIGIPNAALTALGSVTIYLHGAANMAVCVLEIQVVAFNPRDGVHLGLTSLPNAAAGAVGGVNDVARINGVVTTSVTTINANIGTTQPTNFTGTAGAALVKSDMQDIAGSAVSATTAQLGVNVVNWNNTVVATPATAGIPDVNVKNWVNNPPLGLLNQYVQCDVERWNGTVVHSNPPDTIFIRYNTAQAGGASTITLDSGASATTNFYQNCIVQITGGTGAGQSAYIVSYNGGTKVATIAGTWATNPDATSTFNILPFGVPMGAPAGATFAADLAEIEGETDGIAAIPTSNPTVAQIANGVWTDATGSDFTAAGSIGKSLFTSGNAPGAASGLSLVGSQMDLVNAPNATALNAAADALLDRSAAIETGITPRLALRYIAAACCGVITDAGGTTEIFAGVNVATARITATVDSAGDRSAIMLS